MSDPFYWRLVYVDDHVEDEPDDNASILFSRPGAVELQACKLGIVQGVRIPVVSVPLNGDKPVFYRKRSMTLGGSASLESTIIGRGNEQGATLWISYGGEFADCPLALVDETALEHLLTIKV